MHDVVVVGSGVAGLVAGSALFKAGLKTLVLEGSSRIGGRLKTAHFGDGVVELGAEWVHGEKDNIACALARENNIDMHPVDLDFTTYLSNGVKADEALCTELFKYGYNLIDSVDAGVHGQEVLGNFFTRKLHEYIEENPHLKENKEFCVKFVDLFHLLSKNLEGCDNWFQMTTKSLGQYVKCEGHQNMSFVDSEGYGRLKELLLKRSKVSFFAVSEIIRLKKEVVKIRYGTDKEEVKVFCKDGSTFLTKSVIVTVSLGVLKERYNKMFIPALPRMKVNAIEKLSYGTVNKILLQYEEPWWGINVAFAFIWNNKEMEKLTRDEHWLMYVFGITVPRNATNVITLWTSGEVAREVENMPMNKVKIDISKLVNLFLGKEFNITKLENITSSKWYSNPLFRGSYTFHGMECDDGVNPGLELAEPICDKNGKPIICFAGEATSPNHYSTVHGAIETGIREADRIIAAYKN